MKTLCFDQNDFNGCTSIYIKDIELIPAGTTVYAMLVKDKNEEYEKFAKQYDLHFIFKDDVPEIDFYTIPQVDIMAVDSEGGFIGSVGRMTDLESEAPICYISKDKRCYLISENGTLFLREIDSWKEHLKIYEGVKIYKSKMDAMNEYEFFGLDDLID